MNDPAHISRISTTTTTVTVLTCAECGLRQTLRAGPDGSESQRRRHQRSLERIQIPAGSKRLRKKPERPSYYWCQSYARPRAVRITMTWGMSPRSGLWLSAGDPLYYRDVWPETGTRWDILWIPRPGDPYGRWVLIYCSGLITILISFTWDVSRYVLIQANMMRLTKADIVLGRRRRRRANIKPALV